MSPKAGTTKALQDRARSEARAKKPGSVMVQFLKPVNRVPFWRRAIEFDYTQMFMDSGCNVQGDTIVINTVTSKGTVTRLLNWRDVREVIVVPPIDTDTDKKS